MTNRKRHLTAQIKPATKHALMAQLALAADEIIELNQFIEGLCAHDEWTVGWNAGYDAALGRPWWRRLLGLR